MKAYWNGKLIAESENTIIVEGNHYFPPGSIKKEYFKETNTHTYCPWKGQANYLSLKIDGEENTDAAWYYPEASDQAKNIENYVAFWNGVEVKE